MLTFSDPFSEIAVVLAVAAAIGALGIGICFYILLTYQPKSVVRAGRCPQPTGRRGSLAPSTRRIYSHGAIPWRLVASWFGRCEHSAD